jgi:hypothetical protein
LLRHAGSLPRPVALATLYAKGGAAWVRNNYNDIQVAGSCAFCATGLNNIDASTNVTQLGWTVGIGLEYMFPPNWSVFVEYDYLDFGTAHVFFGFPAGSIPANNTFQISQHIQAILEYWPVSTSGLTLAARRSLPDTDVRRPGAIVPSCLSMWIRSPHQRD